MNVITKKNKMSYFLYLAKITFLRKRFLQHKKKQQVSLQTMRNYTKEIKKYY